jgi:hypothetical protein
MFRGGFSRGLFDGDDDGDDDDDDSKFRSIYLYNLRRQTYLHRMRNDFSKAQREPKAGKMW